MSLAYTTLSAAITPNQTSFSVASATNITNPVFNTGAGITYLLVEQEAMLVTSVTGTVVQVQRGVLGTRAMNHGNACFIMSGLPADFLGFFPAIKAFTINQPDIAFQMPSQTVTAAASIIAPSNFFHLSGATGVTNMQPPTSALLSYTGSSTEENYANGTRVTIICDSTPAFTSGGGGTGVAFAATVVAATAATVIEFILDGSSGTQLWYPTRHST